MNEVANGGKRKLVRTPKVEVFWVIEIALPTNALDFSNLTSASSGLVGYT
jgi:hypothetical protein